MNIKIGQVNFDINFNNIKQNNLNFDLYNKIEILKSADDDFKRSDLTSGIDLEKVLLKKSDWNQIILLCEKELMKSCDTVVLARFMEAISAVYGLKGLELNLRILKQMPLDLKPKIFDWAQQKIVNFIFKNQILQKAFLKNQYEDISREDIMIELKELINLANEFCFILIEKQLRKLEINLEQIKKEYENLNEIKKNYKE